LARTLPVDQDSMEAELASYAKQALATNGQVPSTLDDSLVSIEDRMTSFDGTAVKQSFMYVREGIKEIKMEMTGSSLLPCHCVELESSSGSDDGSAHGSAFDGPQEQGLPVIGDFASGSCLYDRGDNRGNFRHPDETTPLVV